MKHTKLLVVALLVALLACLAMSASAETYTTFDRWQVNPEMSYESTCYRPGVLAEDHYEMDAEYNWVHVGYRETPLPLKAHTWGDWTQVVDATCTHPGEQYRICTVCQAAGIVNYDKSTVRYYPEQLPHDELDVVSDKIPATCTEPGYNKLVRCSMCGKVDPKGNGYDGSKIAPTGHKFDTAEWKVEQEATCAKEGKAYRECLNKQRDGVTPCGAKDYSVVPKSPIHRGWTDDTKLTVKEVKGYNRDEHNQPKDTDDGFVWKLVRAQKDAYCTTAGCKAIYQCPICGAQIGGEVINPLGHKVNNTWTVLKEATCANEGKAARLCDRVIDIYGNTCDYELETISTPKASSHYTYDKNPGGTKVTTKLPGSDYKKWGNTYEEYLDKVNDGGKDDAIWAFITPAKPASCEVPGCTAIFRCKICGKTIGGEKIPAGVHDWWPSMKDDGTPDRENATCLKDGYIKYECPKCGATKKLTVPATGHYATWAPAMNTSDHTSMVWDDMEYTVWVLRCGHANCDAPGGILATQLVKKGEIAPNGTVVTGAAKAATTSTASSTAATTAKASSTKKSTATAASTASTKTAAAAPAAAAAAPAAKKVATVAAVMAAPAVELEPNQAQLVADKHLYVVKNVAGEEIVLTVNIVDGKITVEANLAEGESLVLYANAEAVEAPTAENTLVLTANEAVELPEAFANAILAVVKTESLPAAVAAK